MEELNKKNVIHSFCCDGSCSSVMEQAFMKKVDAKPMYSFLGSEKEIWDCLATPIIYKFIYNNKTWIIYDTQIIAVKMS